MPEPETVLDNKAAKEPEPAAEVTVTAPQSEVCPKEAAVETTVPAATEEVKDDSKKRPLELISNVGDDIHEATEETSSKKLKVDEVEPAKEKAPEVEKEPEQVTEAVPEAEVKEAEAESKMPETEAKVPETELKETEVEQKEPEVTAAAPETLPAEKSAVEPEAAPETKMPETTAAPDTTPSVLKDIPSSKMQQDAFQELNPEAKDAKVSSTDAIEKMYQKDLTADEQAEPVAAPDAVAVSQPDGGPETVKDSN